MNSTEINLVQSSFAEVRPIAVVAAELFYNRLFTLDPTLRPMFKGDMAHQGRMLMSMLHSAVNGLTNLDALVPVVRQLGARHVGYGVRTNTMQRWAAHCCGRWNRAWATSSPPMYARPGPRPTNC